MRVFFAIEMPPAVTRRAGEMRRAVETSEPQVGPNLRWVARSHLHVTLRFIGEVDEATGGQLIRLLAAAFPVPPFECDVGGPAWLPGARRARVLVLGLGGDLARLARVKLVLDERLEGLGFEREARPFRPHVTLARVRDRSGGPPPDAAQRVVECGAAVVPLAFTVDRVVLYRSRLSPRGPSYDVLATAPLRGAGGAA
jgi:RNA 2',3'-cyclic 3'-phosphodiesterase